MAYTLKHYNHNPYKFDYSACSDFELIYLYKIYFFKILNILFY